jgi:hypothetical protein
MNARDECHAAAMRKEAPMMVPRASTVTIVLVGLLALSSPRARAVERPSGPVSQAQLDQAIATKLGDDDAARHSIRRLLQREDVQRLARGYGLDARRAEAAVGTLSGEELRRRPSEESHRRRWRSSRRGGR